MGAADDHDPGRNRVSRSTEPARAPRFRRPVGRGNRDTATPVAWGLAPARILRRRAIVEATRKSHGLEALVRIHPGMPTPGQYAENRREGHSTGEPRQALRAASAAIPQGLFDPAISRIGRSHAQNASGHGAGGLRQVAVVGQESAQHDQRPMPEVERVGHQAQSDQCWPRQCPGQRMGGVSEADQHTGRAHGGDQGHGPERRIGMRHRHQANQDKGQADPTGGPWQSLGDGRRPCPVRRGRTQQQFPGAGGQQVEGARRMVPRTVGPEGQTQDGGYREAAEVHPAFSVQQE